MGACRDEWWREAPTPDFIHTCEEYLNTTSNQFGVKKTHGTQLYYVKWGETLSAYFSVTNGVRQGGILSPWLT